MIWNRSERYRKFYTNLTHSDAFQLRHTPHKSVKDTDLKLIDVNKFNEECSSVFYAGKQLLLDCSLTRNISFWNSLCLYQYTQQSVYLCLFANTYLDFQERKESLVLAIRYFEHNDKHFWWQVD